jgi:hypothetical protein
MNFRWRENPTVLAQYLLGKNIPEQAEITLKPNEICVVLEDGKVVGSVSQQHMEVNPELGLFGRMLGKRNPQRAFMFCFSGPHQIMVHVKGQSDAGEEINCLVNLTVEITRESAPRLVTYPAKGTLMVESHHIAETVRSEVQSAVMTFVKGMPLSQMKSVTTHEDLMFHLKSSLRPTLDMHGLHYRGGHITWSASVVEQQLQQQQTMARLRLEKSAISERQEIEMDSMIQYEQKKHEIQSRLSLVGIHATEKANLELELQRIKNKGTVSFEEWTQANQVRTAESQSNREESLLDAQANFEVSKIQAEQERLRQSVELELQSNKAKTAMDMFEQVQARKKDRMKLQNEKEQQRMEQHTMASQSTIAVLENIAASSSDPQVQMEALRQLAEIRKADIQGQNDTHVDS